MKRFFFSQLQTRCLLSTKAKATPTLGLYAQGYGAFGALGTGDLRCRDNFTHVKLPDNLVPRHVSAGYGHSGIVTTCGKLFISGIPIEFKRVIRVSAIGDISKTFGE